MLGKIKRYISRGILPENKLKDESEYNNEYKTDKNCEQLEVTCNGEKLDTVEIKNDKNEKKPPEEKKYIIQFLGINYHYKDKIGHSNSKQESSRTLAQNLNCNIVCFNYQGVGKSTGQTLCKNDLVQNGIAQVKRLLEMGIKPENIVLHGHSLGGAIATLVAAHFHTKDPKNPQKVKVFNDRSFSKMSRVAISWLENDSPYGCHMLFLILKKLPKPLSKFIIKSLLKITGWEIDAVAAYQKISDDCKMNIAIRADKEKREQLKESHNFEIDDKFVPYSSSLLKGLSKDDRKKITDDNKTVGQTSRVYSKISLDYHNEPLCYLKNRNGKTARDMLYKFLHGVYPEQSNNNNYNILDINRNLLQENLSIKF